MTKITTDVVVVGYRSDPFIERLYRDLPGMTRRGFRLHVWDNTGVQRNLAMVKNDLAAQGTAEYILFANGDVLFAPGWDERLITFLEGNIEYGAVIPLPVGDRRYAHLWNPDVSEKDWPEEPLPTAERMTALSEQVASAEGFHRYHPKFFCLFFAVLMRRQTWSDLKGFDERFRFSHSDLDFQKRMGKSLGLMTAGLRSCALFHGGGNSRREAASRKEIDLPKEAARGAALLEAIQKGELTEWHSLTDEERRAFRKDPAHIEIPKAT